MARLVRHVVMKHVLAALLALSAAPALAQNGPFVPLPDNAADGPWVALEDGQQVFDGPLTEADLVKLADLDGDPSVVSAEEQEMIDVLREVLMTAPVAPVPEAVEVSAPQSP